MEKKPCLSIANLSRSEKLQMMEAIWEDLTRDVIPLSSPSWHIEALQQAERDYAENRTRFVSWDVAKQMLRDKPSVIPKVKMTHFGLRQIEPRLNMCTQ